jgi:hypothetical protein
VGIVALASGGAMAQQAAPGAERASFSGNGSRGLAFATGVEMLAWDNGFNADEALAKVGTAPPSYSVVSGDVTQVVNGPEIEYGQDGVLYVAETSVNTLLHRLDPVTGGYLGVINLTFPPQGNVITSMEWIEGQLWAGLTTESGGGASNTFLCTIDTGTGEITVEGDTGINRPFGGLAWAGGSVVYAITAGGSTPELYAIGSDGFSTLIGPVMEQGVAAPRMTALEFGPDGQLYALPNALQTNSGDLYLINPSTAEAVNLGPTGNTGLVALTTVNRCNEADMAAPFGVLNFDDVLAFLTAFGAGCGL